MNDIARTIKSALHIGNCPFEKPHNKFQNYIQTNAKIAQVYIYRVLRKKCAVSKVNKKSISHLTRLKRTPSVAATVQVSHVLPAV
jgi:hypothetical protein